MLRNGNRQKRPWHLTKIWRYPSFGEDCISPSTFLRDYANLQFGRWVRRTGGWPRSDMHLEPSSPTSAHGSQVNHCSSGSLVALAPGAQCSAECFLQPLSPTVRNSSTGLVSQNFERYFFPLFLIFCLYLSHLAAVIGDKGQCSRRLTKGNTCFFLATWPSAHPATPVPSLVSIGVTRIGQLSALISTGLQRRLSPRGGEKSAKGQMHHLYSRGKSPLNFDVARSLLFETTSLLATFLL